MADATGSGWSRRGLTIGLLMCVAAIAFESMAVLTAMPAAARELGHLDLYAWAFTGFVIAQTFAIVAAGRFCDRTGPVPPLIVGFGLFAAGLVLAGTAGSMPVLLAARFVQGLGGGTMNLAVMVLVARMFGDRERATLLTWFSAAWMGPAFIGPPIAAWLAETWSWHWVFWSVLPLLAVAAVLVADPLRRHPPGPPPGEPEPHPLGFAALVALAAALVQWAGQRIEPLSLLWGGVGLVLLAVALPPLMPRGFAWFGHGLSAVVRVRALTAGAFFGAQTFLPLMLVEARQAALLWAGATVTIGSIGWMLGAWLQSRPWLTWRRDTIVIIGTSATALGLVAVAGGGWVPGSWLGVVVLGWVVAGLGMGLSTASTSLAVMQLSEPVELGRNTSSLQVGEALGNSITAGLAGTIFALAHPLGDVGVTYGALMSAMVAVAVGAAVSGRRIGPVRNHSVSL